jgi:hypothetical protein
MFAACPFLLAVGIDLLRASFFPFSTIFFPSLYVSVSTIDHPEYRVTPLLGGKK